MARSRAAYPTSTLTHIHTPLPLPLPLSLSLSLTHEIFASGCTSLHACRLNTCIWDTAEMDTIASRIGVPCGATTCKRLKPLHRPAAQARVFTLIPLYRGVWSWNLHKCRRRGWWEGGNVVRRTRERRNDRGQLLHDCHPLRVDIVFARSLRFVEDYCFVEDDLGGFGGRGDRSLDGRSRLKIWSYH